MNNAFNANRNIFNFKVEGKNVAAFTFCCEMCELHNEITSTMQEMSSALAKIDGQLASICSLNKKNEPWFQYVCILGLKGDTPFDFSSI